MATVTGIGGVFFRAKDAEGLAAWYRKYFGIGFPWEQQAGMTVFAPFAADTDYFAADRQWMINLRVDDLETILATLAADGISAERRAEWDTPETGNFARIHDPEGNPIELWQPAG